MMYSTGWQVEWKSENANHLGLVPSPFPTSCSSVASHVAWRVLKVTSIDIYTFFAENVLGERSWPFP